MAINQVSIVGYRITEELYNGSRTLVYRGNREIDSLPVVIKLLKNPYPSFSELLSFRNQYTIAKNLNYPGIIQTYSLQASQNGYALVMEDFGGISLKNYFISDQTRYIASLEEFLEIAIALCNTLDILYQERIIHKDIKPANILINPESKQVKLIDFSIASLLPRETQTLINPNVLEGTLAYISPEQTGRMNRGIDYRTDFYSLGITFYELLTGELPFTSNDPMELVHSHISKLPPPLFENREEIPQVISDIVMKLMAKNAEDRYQNALGLKFDLENCLCQLQRTGAIKTFEIAQRDVSYRFIIPDKLYGRETEVSTLLEAFARVSLGATEMMLVAGFSGIGKTAVVNEVHKPIVRQRGYFIKGKYDQFQRNIPFSGFVQAFRDLIEQLLTQSDAQIQQWKSKILSAVGENGQVIIEVIPELSRIIGEQAPATELSGTAAQNRFNLLFQKFIQVFTEPEHPLVIFLDDLQWADSASLNLMQLLISKSKTGYLLLIGAYRNNEVFPAHPLILRLDAIVKTKAIVNTITLKPLMPNSLNHLVADTLNCTETLARPLTDLVYQKTQGNPFFATQFLKALHQDGLIEFDLQAGHWLCDIARVSEAALTDDVVEFMMIQLQKLPPATETLLKLAACIGNQFNLTTLAIVSEQSEIETAAALWPGLQEGLILPIRETYKFFQSNDSDNTNYHQNITVPYKFLHDRVQQAAYSLISESQRQAIHYKIGQLLLENLSPSEQNERLFDIVNQINYGQYILEEEIEREKLAKLNLVAGQKAKLSIAYEAAINYLKIGISLLGEGAWDNQYDLSFNLYRNLAEAQLSNGNFQALEETIAFTLKWVISPIDRADIYVIQIIQYTLQSKYQEAIQVGLLGLDSLGIVIARDKISELIGEEFAAIEKKLENRSIDSLLDLPTVIDPVIKATITLLIAIDGSTYLTGDLEVYTFVSLKATYLSIEHGNVPASIKAYINYGLLLGMFQQRYQRGYELGNFAIQLSYKLNSPSERSKACLLLGGWIQVWAKPIAGAANINYEGFLAGVDSGEIQFVENNLFSNIFNRLFQGEYLAAVAEDIEKYWLIGRKDQNELFLFQNERFLLALAGANIFIINLCQEQDRQIAKTLIPEDEFIDRADKSQSWMSLCLYYILKMHFSCLIGNFEQGLHYTTEAGKILRSVTGFTTYSSYFYYGSLILLNLYPTLSHAQQSDVLQQVRSHQEHLQKWSDNCPENFLHKYLLVEAEYYRLLENNAAAIDLYDRAISEAKANEYIQEEALANELAAKFYLGWGKERIAGNYMIEAYYSYTRWGAKAKVAELERHYPQLLASILQQNRTAFSVNETVFALETLNSKSSSSSSSSISDSLDLKAILKASQTISGEIELEKLLSSLLSILLENAGADKCVLMLLRDERLLIKGLITEGSEPVVFQRIPIDDSQDIPLKLIYKVKHNHLPVVLINANDDPTLANDPYILRQQPKSILCSPILHQRKLLGILYLENNLATGAFTSDRVELLNLLSAQAAISLENALFYQQALENAQQLERSLNELNVVQSRFYNLVDNVPGVVYQYRMTPEGVISLTYISADCYNLLEITSEQAMSNWQFFEKMVYPEDIPSFLQSQTQAIQTRSVWEWSGRIVTPSGIIKWIHGESRIEELADGSVVWDGLLLNISDRKRAEQELQNAQLQIIQSEKMSALGNLVAGVAHEMNNPLGFITASLKQAKPTFTDIIAHLKLYQESLPNKSAEILDHAEEIDLDYSLEDLPKMIDSMSIACDRLKNISTSLRTFSRADQDYKVPFNIHEGIDSTILILKHRLKANEQRPAIEVVTNYGNLPKIECFPGQLNQVFMNILANAIDALNESSQGRSFEEIKANPNRITITTFVLDNQVQIAIADNGIGMSEAVKQKIFDHLFTTKAVGKGTGLGLAIARQIVVEKHNGSLNVNSTLGEGTEFVITLPSVGRII